ncbi:MAG: hypothetical protein QXL09_01210 [Candidatus Aenigmatarchaeota archaeon]|nr:hypothetical protein [Candidatus Aenigmarchaeota archaeon]
MADLYTMLAFSVGILILIMGLQIAHKVLSSDFSLFSNIHEKVGDPQIYVCETDSNCIEGDEKLGVCVAGDCICFLDEHCSNGCDIGRGICKR